MTRRESDPDLVQTVRALMAAGRSGEPLEEALERVREATTSETWSPDGPISRAVDLLSNGEDFGAVESLLDGWLHTETGGDRYQVETVLGRGGMGEVVAARDTQLDRPVALKFLAHGMPPGVAARFDLEAKITAQLTHPNVVPVHDAGRTADGRAFISMKRVDGASLGEKLDEGALTLSEGIRILDRVCDAMRFAHARGVLHRDLKPDNIMVGAFGEVLVMDWGLARSPSGDFVSTADSTDPANGNLTRVGQIMGTPAYMPPEQARGDRDAMGPHSDVYALGAVLFTIATGRPPFDEGSAYDIVQKVAEEQIPSARAVNPRVSRDVDAVITRAMMADPRQRYPSVDALQADLRQLLEGGRVSVMRYSRLDGLLRWAWKRRAPLTAAGSVGLAASVVLGLGLVGAVGLATLGTWTYVRDLNAQVDVSRRSLHRQLQAEGWALLRSKKPAQAQERFHQAAEMSQAFGLDGRSAWFGERVAGSRRGVYWTVEGRIIDASPDALLVRHEGSNRWLHPGSAKLLQQRDVDQNEVAETWGTVRRTGEGYRMHPLRGEPVELELPPVPEGFSLRRAHPEVGFVTAVAPGRVAYSQNGGPWTIKPGLQAVPNGERVVVLDRKHIRVFGVDGMQVGGDRSHWRCGIDPSGSGCIGHMSWRPVELSADGPVDSPLEGTRDIDVWNGQLAVAQGRGLIRFFDAERNELAQLDTRSVTDIEFGGNAIALSNSDGGDGLVSVYGIPTPLVSPLGHAMDSDVHPEGLLVTTHDRGVTLWDAVSGLTFWTVPLMSKSNTVRFDPSEPIVWTATIRGRLVGLDVPTGRPVRDFQMDGGVNAIAFLDGHMYAVMNRFEGGEDAAVVRLDADSGEVLAHTMLRGVVWDLEVLGDSLVAVSQHDGLGTRLNGDLETIGEFQTLEAVDTFGMSPLGDGLVIAGIHQLYILEADGTGRLCEPDGSRRWMSAREIQPGLVYAVGLDEGAVLVDTETCEVLMEVEIPGAAPTAAIYDDMLWHLGAHPRRIDLRERLDVDAAVHASKRGDEAVLRTAYLRAGIHGLAASLPTDDSVDSVRAALIRGPESTAEALAHSTQTGVWIDTARAFAEGRSAAFTPRKATPAPP